MSNGGLGSLHLMRDGGIRRSLCELGDWGTGAPYVNWVTGGLGALYVNWVTGGLGAPCIIRVSGGLNCPSTVWGPGAALQRIQEFAIAPRPRDHRKPVRYPGYPSKPVSGVPLLPLFDFRGWYRNYCSFAPLTVAAGLIFDRISFKKGGYLGSMSIAPCYFPDVVGGCAKFSALVQVKGGVPSLPKHWNFAFGIFFLFFPFFFYFSHVLVSLRLSREAGLIDGDRVGSDVEDLGGNERARRGKT